MKRLLVLCLAVLGLCLAPPAFATDISVDCDANGNSGLQAAIDSLAGTPGPHTITVTGTCVEHIDIDRFDRLTIQAPEGQTATLQSAASDGGVMLFINRSGEVSLRRLIVDGAGHFVDGVWANRSDVVIQESTIQSTGSIGVIATDDSRIGLGGGPGAPPVLITNNVVGAFSQNSLLTLNRNVTVDNNSEDALFTQGGRLAVNGADAGTVIRNNGFGVALTQGTTATFNGNNLIENNGPYGVLATRGAVVNFNGNVLPDATTRFTTIQGHQQFGLLLGDASVSFGAPGTQPVHQVHNNGASGSGFRAGIFQSRPGVLLLRNVSVSNNGGAGVHLAAGAYANLINAAVNNNSEDGLRFRHLSVGEFGGLTTTGESFPANTTILGNGGSTISCDITSVVFGDLADFPNVQCTQADRRARAPQGMGNASAAEAAAEERIQRRRREPPQQ